MATGRREAGIALVETILAKKQPSQILMLAAQAALEAERVDLAQQALQQAQRQAPRALEEVLSQARELSNQGNYKLVSSLLEAVRPSGENSAEWNALLGYAEYKLQDPSKSSAHLQRAIALAPQVEEYYLKMGELLLYYNSDEAAVTFFKKGLENISNSASLHFGLAAAYWSHQLDPGEAAEHLSKALEIEPDFQSALELRCLIQHRLKDWGPLQETADRLIRSNPNFSPGYYFKGAAIAAQAYLSEAPDRALATARQLLEKAVHLQPEFAEVHIELGKLLVRDGDIARAIHEFQQAVKIDPNDSRAYYNLASTYRRVGEQEKSKQALAKFEQIKTQKKEREGWEALFHMTK